MIDLNKIREDEQKTDKLVEDIADYMEFMGDTATDEELGEDDLELVTAARSSVSYAQFLQRMKKHKL